MTGLVKRSFTLSGHRTSVALEAEFWAALTMLAADRPLSALVAEIDAARGPERPLASALRVHALLAKPGSTGEDAYPTTSANTAGSAIT